jgi:hypothetical protein
VVSGETVNDTMKAVVVRAPMQFDVEDVPVDAGYSILDTGCWILDTGCWMESFKSSKPFKSFNDFNDFNDFDGFVEHRVSRCAYLDTVSP